MNTGDGTLHHDIWGRGERLVLAHGFTQNRRCWGPFGHELAADHQVVAVDLPGHGATDPAHDGADVPTAGRLLAATGGEAVFIGYSMGARIALHAALHAALDAPAAQPGQVRALVLIGATAGLDGAADRAARRQADETLAAELLAGGLPAFLDRWLANPLFAGLSPAASARDQRLANRPEGLATSLRRAGTGTQEPVWDQLGRLTMPVLVLVGEDDLKFTAEGERLMAHLPRATMTVLPGTHAVHLEQPTAAAAAVRRFLHTELGYE